MNLKYIRLLTLALFSLTYSFVFAGRIDQTSSIHTPLGGSPVVVGTATAMDSVSVSSPSALEVDHHLFNRISFGVDLDYEEFVSTEQKVKVSIHLERFNANNVALPSLDFYLDISYRHSDTLHSHILSSYDFSGVYKFIYRIDSIWVDDVLTNTLPKNLFVQGDLLLERYTTLNTTTQVSSNLSFMDTDHDGINDGIEFRWSNIAGAEAYEIEFMHVSNFGSSGSIISPSSLSYDFRNNSTRITTSELSYRIALVFDRGWVAYRVRPVGVDVNNPDHLIYGSWNALRSGKIANLNNNNKIEITAGDVHESTLNWQYSATYGENGKRKEVISYADGSLRSRQAVTKINSNDNVVVGETIYDYLGRPVVNVLPTPVERNSNDTLTLKYYPSFNLNSQGLPYSKKDFTDTTESCGVGADFMRTDSGASRYYSSENPNQDLHQGYVPDAGGYPFTQVEYTPDKTGRINRQGGVGADFQIGSGKESRYLYGNPTQLELDRMFGSEVGYSEHYQKNVVIDGNGQASVSYVDLSGRVIATALAGSSPNNLTSINNAEEQALEINQILPDGSNQEVDLLNNSITFSSSFILSSPSDVAISYEFLTTPMIDTCVTDVCFDCVYDLEFTLRDECGNNLLPDSLQHKVIGNFVLNGEGETVFHSDCVDTSSFNAYVELTSLPIGKYTISKKLTIHEAAIESYLNYIDSSVCVKTYEDFLFEELNAIDTLACEISCDNCLDNLGSLSDYVGNGYGTSADYYLEVEECQKLCEKKVSDCEIYFTMLTVDMSPGGQYAGYLTPSGEEVWNFPLSILNASNQLLTSGASWRNPQLITPNGAISHYVNEQGERARIYLTEDADSAGLFLPRPASTGAIEYDAAQDAYFIYPENLKNVSDFVDYFEYSWAKSLVSYHPEYCYYESCIKHEEKYTATDDFSSASFDELLQNTTSFQQAQTLGLIDGNGLPTNWFTISSTQPWDPFVVRSSSFEGSNCSGFTQALQTKFTKYKFILGEWYSMAEIAAYTIRCGGDLSQQPDPSCFSFGQPFSGVQSVDTVILNKEWNVLKSLYLSAKQEFKQELADCIALKECKRFNGCIGNDEFNPYPELIGLHLTSPQDLFNQPFFNENHLCSYFNYELYRDKIKRFSNAEDVIQDHDANSTSYEVYLQTGQCPNAFVLQHLLNELVEKEKLLENGFNLNTLDYLSALFQSDNNYNNPGPIPSLTYEVSSTSTNLTAEWKDASNNLYATLTLTKGSLVDWTDITAVSNLQSTGTHSFIAEGKYVENDTVKYISLTGNLTPEISTQFKLDDCSFAHECSSSQLAIDLTGLFNILNLNGDLFSTTPISISPYAPLGSSLATLYIENAAGMGSNLNFVFNQSENYIRIYDASVAGNHGLYIQFLSVVGTVINLNDITGVELMTSTGNSSFEIVAHQLNGDDLTYSGILYQVYGDGEKVGLSAGKCDLPTPMACQGRAYEVFEDIQPLLEDALSQFDGTAVIDLYSSIYITPSIVSSFPYGVDFTTSEDYGDSLVISAGSCDVVLSLQDNSNSLEFKNLVAISSFELTGEINFDLGYNDFYFVGSFNTPSGIVEDTVFGTSCITLKDCYPCGEEEETLSAMQMDSWGDFSLLALDSSVVSNVGGTSPLFLPMGCEEYWDVLNECVHYFIENYQGVLDNMTIEYLTHIDLDCECGADFYCDLLYYILGENRVFSSTNELLDFIDYERNCKGCRKDYEGYLGSVMKFNSEDYPYSITPISEVLFVAYGFCDCVEEYDAFIFDILANKLTFSSQEEFDNYVSLNRVCQGTEVDCGANKETYYVCVENFIKYYEGTPFYEFIITYFENIDIDCSCNSKNYCELLERIIMEKIEFQTIDELLNFIDYQRNCVGCELAYDNYLGVTVYFNNSDYKLKITPIDYNLFIAYDFCDCIELYQDMLNQILINQMEFPNQAAFDNYVSLHRICNEGPISEPINEPVDVCKEAYSAYINCNIALVESDVLGNLTLNAISYEDFMAGDFCLCVDAYCSAIDALIMGLVELESQDYLDRYLSRALSCNVKPECTPHPSSTPLPDMPEVETVNDCVETAKNIAVTNAQNAYNNYIDSVHTVNREKYVSYCMQTKEKLYTNYDDRQHHYTLYYYDQAGNLIKTIPPEGVELLTFTSTDDPIYQKIHEDRLNGERTVFTNHRLQTRYEYNSLNQLVAQFTPDTDAMEAFEITLPNGLHAGLTTEKIQMLSESLGYLAGHVGDRGYLYKTLDGGKTWNRITNLLASDLKKIKMLDSQFGIAIGEFGTVLKTKDGGTSWDMITTWHIPEMLEELNDLAVNQSGDSIMIVGNNGLTAIVTNFNSQNPVLTTFNTTVSGHILGVAYTDNKFVSTAHNPLENISLLYTFNTSTEDWQEMNVMMNNNFTAVDLFESNKAYASDNDGRIYRNKDLSATNAKWIHQSSNLKDTIHEILFFNESQGIAIVHEENRKKLFRTIDGAKTWIKLSDSSFTTLSIDAGREIITAGGENGNLTLLFPYQAGTEEISMTNVPNEADITAVWIKKIGNDFAVITAFNDNTVSYTKNVLTTYPSWHTISTSFGSNVKKIVGSETSGTLHGVLLSENNQAVNFSVNLSTSVLALGSTLSGNYTAISEGDNYFYLTRIDGNLIRKAKSNSTALVSMGALPFDANLVSTNGNEMVVGRNEISSGDVGIAHLLLNSNGSGISSTTNQTQKVYPDKLNGLIASGDGALAYGNDGLLYLCFSSTGPVVRMSHSENRNIYDGKLLNNGKLYFVGEEGLAIEGEFYPFGINATDLQTTGGSVSSVTSSDLHAIHITQDNRMYIAGENGTVLYSPEATGTGSMPLNLLNQGNVDLHSISAIPGQNGRVLMAGENGRIQTQIGAMQMINNHVYVPPLRDVHFKNGAEATIIADHFVVRSTTLGENKWQVVLPPSGVFPGSDYKKVWTLGGGKSLLFGVGNTLIGQPNQPSQIAFSAANVTALSKGRSESEIYFSDANTVKRLSLTNTSSPVTISTITGSNTTLDLHVFTNGDFIAVGENGLYRHYVASSNNFLSYSGPATTGNLRAVTFTDHISGVIVGDYNANGNYFSTQNQSVSPLGYLENADWQAKPILGVGIDPENLTQANINTLAAASSTDFLIGGSTQAQGITPYVRVIYDAGDRYSNRFYYDRLGRLVVSQNARQEAENKYSYTLYDALGRTIEAGEKTENENQSEKRFKDIFGAMVNGHLNPSTIDDAKLSEWIAGSGARREVTRSYYDGVSIAGLPAVISSDPTTQRHRIVHVTFEEEYDGNDQTFDHATHYSYDIHGNVKTLLQDNKKMAESFPSLSSQRFKRMDYAYDLISGNVHRMSVQNGEADQWHHAYFYDGDNRIQRVYTNTSTPLTPITHLSQNMANELEHNSDWQLDAKYYYYDHGPLARIELGENNLQGLDYYYTLQGWLKGVNSSVLEDEHDPGEDSNPSEINALFAKDVFGFGLSYYENDYTAINGATPLANIQNTSHAAQNSADLYNGNIRFMQTSIINPLDRTKMPMLNAYKYDQLNRLKESRSYENGLSSNTWNPTSYGNEYFNAFTYDAMGNILTQERHIRNGTQIEDMTYRYRYDANNKLLRNRLYHINDNIASNVDSTDIDDQGVFNSDPDFIETANNYVRDKMGRLVKDRQEEIDTVIWTASNKVKEIRRNFDSNKKNIIFDYDAMGNQIAKHVYNNQTLMLEKSTYYILDAQGNQLSIYEHSVDSATNTAYYYLTDRNIYGSSRLGVTKDTINMFNPYTLQSYGVIGNRNYELTDHRGNVQTVINDIKYPLSSDNTTIDSYEVGINSIADYSPFGVQLDGRTIDNVFYYPENGNSPQTPADTVEIYNNDFDNPPATGSPYYSTEVTLDANLSNTKWTSSTGTFTNYNSSGAGSGKSIAISSASADTAYLTLSFDVENGYELDITSYSFAHRSSATGYTNYKLVVNGIEIGNGSIFVSSSGSSLQSTGNINVANAVSGQMGTVNVVLKLFGGSHGHSGTFRMDDFVLNGFVQEESNGSSPSNYFVSRNYRNSFQGQEHHDEIRGKGNYINYKYRGYDPRVGRLDWLIDPLTYRYPYNGPYNFSENIVIHGVELEGLEVEIVIERGDPLTSTVNLGHVFVVVDGVVYTYGRYAETNKEGHKSRVSTAGQGVLIKLEGNDAIDFVEKYVNEHHALVYTIEDADKELVKGFFEKKFNNSNEIPKKGAYAGKETARVIDEYDLFDNNCTTLSCEAIAKGGGVSGKDVQIGREKVEYRGIYLPAMAWAYFEVLTRNKENNVINSTSDYKTTELSPYRETTNDQDSNNPNKYKSDTIEKVSKKRERATQPRY